MRYDLAVCLALLGPSLALAESPWTVQPSGSTERFRGVAVVDDRVIWASGNHGTCVRSVDGGTSWQAVPAVDAANLDFRDVEAFSAEQAFVLAIGPGEASRVFKATHSGTSLVEVYRNQDPKGFLDAIAFWDHDHGLALGDPVDGRFVILATDDAGRTWTQLSDPGTMPPALPNEGAFAASGTCLVVGPDDRAWFATGGAGVARVFRSTDRGRSWKAIETQIRADSPSRGIFGLAFLNSTRGVAVGGDYKATADPAANYSTTVAGGLSWSRIPILGPPGFRSAIAFVPGRPTPTLLTVGPGGSDLGFNMDGEWRRLGTADGFHALAVAPSGRFAWAVGDGGKIGRLTIADALKAP